MLIAAVLVTMGGLVWAGGLVGARITATRREVADVVVLRLRFPRRLSAESVERFLAALSGLRLPWWRAFFASPVVGFELVATDTGVEHYVVVNARRADQVRRMLAAHLAQVRVEPVQPDQGEQHLDAGHHHHGEGLRNHGEVQQDHGGELHPLDGARRRVVGGLGASYRSSTSARELRLAPAEVAAGLLHTLSPLGPGEVVFLQLLATPTGVPALPVVRTSTSRPWSWLRPARPGEVGSAAAATALRTKQRLPEVHATLRVVAVAADPDRERRLVRRVEGAMHPTTTPGAHLRRRFVPASFVAAATAARWLPVGPWPLRFNAAEVSQVIGWPIDAIDVPGVKLAGCVHLPVPAPVPTQGTVIGEGFDHRGPRMAALDHDSRTRHMALIGPTGAGKSTLLAHMVIADALAGHGVLVVDPKASLVDDILMALPPAERGRVCVLDPSDAARPVGINPLNPRHGDREAAVAVVFGVLHRVWQESWGVRTADLLHQGLRSLLVDADATLLDLLPLFVDPNFRARVVSRQTDVIVRQFWSQFNALSAGEQAQYTAPLTNKLRQLFGRPSLRRVFAQPHPAFDLGRHLDDGGIVLVSGNAASIGDEAAALYASMLLGLLWPAMQARGTIAPGRRRAWSVHLDEFARLVGLPVPLESFLATARGFDVGFVLALQHLAQVPPDLRAGILSNVRSITTFQLNAADAKLLAPYMGQGVTAEDLGGLDRFEVLARLHAQGRTQSPALLATLPPLPGTGTAAQHRAVSAHRWGADGLAVEAAIAERLAGPNEAVEDLPAGRKRRSS